MNFFPYLSFDGDCEEAMHRYVEIFGGEIVSMQRFRDEESCADMPDEIQDKVMHAQFKYGDGLIMASDAGQHYTKPAGVHVSANFDDVDEAKRVFEGLSEGGDVMMPFSKTFWTEGFGMTRDRFGILWMVNVNAPDSKYY